MLIHVEAFGRVLRVEFGHDEPRVERGEVPYDTPTPMETYADYRHEASRDFIGFTSALPAP